MGSVFQFFACLWAEGWVKSSKITDVDTIIIFYFYSIIIFLSLHTILSSFWKINIYIIRRVYNKNNFRKNFTLNTCDIVIFLMSSVSFTTFRICLWKFLSKLFKMMTELFLSFWMIYIIHEHLYTSSVYTSVVIIFYQPKSW